jgi:hypothetical protein
MTLIAYVHATLASRWREMRTAEESDRGDNPVPTAVIIVGLAVLAAGVMAWAFNLAGTFMDDAVPATPAVPGGAP